MTQHLTNPPPYIEAFADMLDACASYSMDTWYPKAPEGTPGPFAVIVAIDPRRRRYAVGMSGIPGGTLIAMLHVNDTTGNVESLAESICDELMLQQTGLPLNSAAPDICSEVGKAHEAGGETLKAIDITIDYGLNA